MINKDSPIKLEFNGKIYNLRVDDKDDKDDIDVDINDCLIALNNNELFDYLYKYHKNMFDEINNDPYFDGKTIKSGEDLKNSIQDLKVIAYKKGVVYICGEYWCDPEHGFSIKFPNGKFIKSEYDSFDYNRDEGKDANYTPKCTILGQYSDYL